MSLFAKLFVIVALVPELLAYNCAGTQTFNPPANISNSISYPDTWISSNDAPQYAAGQNCTFIINIPKGMFAFLQIKAITNETSTLTLTDSTGYVTTIKIASMEPYFLMDPSCTVSIQSINAGSFGMVFKYYAVNPTFPTTYNVHPNSSPLALFGGDFDNSTVIQADTQVNILALPPSLIAPDVSPYLRNTQVYDGPSINSPHVGNLYQIVANGGKYVSTGKSLTLWSLIPGFATIRNTVILQDYFDVKDFKSYKAIQCVFDPCEISIDARTGTAAVIRFNPAYFFVKDISMPATNVLSVYTDFVTPAHKLADYTSTLSKTNTPQKFNGRFTTFVLNKDQATVRMASDDGKAGWASAIDSRRGFFSSPNYALNSTDQDFNDVIHSFSSTSNISYTVERGAIVGNASLQVMVYSKQQIVANNEYTIKNFPGPTQTAIGDTIFVKYNGNGEVTTGAFVSFGFDRYNSAATNGVLASLALAVWMVLSR